jgi:ATP-dependent DNA helicase RecG
LALAVYGDLDLSIIDELPPGRKRIKTFVVPNEKREAGYRWVRDKVKAGNQAFIVCPLIEESEGIPTKDRGSSPRGGVRAVTAEYKRLQSGAFSNIPLGLLHGRLKAKEKDEAIRKFREGEYKILISTPVVEVGIDIPTATIMVIEAADRFGLASLHQLRGRVGRGDKESYCFLFTEKGGRSAFRRLKALESTASGFELAELDLKLRGPGEIYGTKQHGLMELKVADLSNAEMLKDVQESAQEAIDKGLTPNLKKELNRFTSVLIEPN